MPLGAVAGEVGLGEAAGADDAVGVRVGRRLVDGAHDVAGERAPVEGFDALAAQLRVGAGEVGVAEGGAGLGEFPAGQEELGAGGEVGEPGLVVGGLGAEGLVHGEAVAGQALGRFQQLAQWFAAPAVEQGAPGGGGAGGADAEAAGDGLGEGDGLAVLQEEVGSRGTGRGLPPVDGLDGAGAGVVEDGVPAAADARGVRLGDAQRGGGGDGRVHGVATPAQHLDPGGGGVLVDAGDGAAVAHRDGGLAGHRPLGRPRVGWRGGAHREHRHGEGAEREPARGGRTHHLPPVSSRPRSVTSPGAPGQDASAGPDCSPAAGTGYPLRTSRPVSMTSAMWAAPRLFWWMWSVVSRRPRRREIASKLRRSTACWRRTPTPAAGVASR